jgi:hypothetical protein
MKQLFFALMSMIAGNLYAQVNPRITNNTKTDC